MSRRLEMIEVRTYVIDELHERVAALEAVHTEIKRLISNDGPAVEDLPYAIDQLLLKCSAPEMGAETVVAETLRPRRACNNYSRPKGFMGGPCLNCGLSQPEHVHG